MRKHWGESGTLFVLRGREEARRWQRCSLVSSDGPGSADLIIVGLGKLWDASPPLDSKVDCKYLRKLINT
jgi:hypothetical protein